MRRPVDSYIRSAHWTRSSWRSRVLLIMLTRAALWTTRLRHRATSTVTTAMAALSFQRSPLRNNARTSGPQLVPETAHGLDPVLSDLGPQPLDVDVDDPGVATPLVVPHPLQQLVAGHHGAGRARELQQQPH